MAYQHGRTLQAAPAMSVEQARRRNAEARIELARLEAEHAYIAPRLEAMRSQVTTARRKLTRQVRDLEALRSQVAQLEAVKELRVVELTEPVFGGPEGLKAAADEMDSHESKGLKLVAKRPNKGPSHGTRRRYESGCRCEECQDWWQRKLKAERNRRRRHTDSKAA